MLEFANQTSSNTRAGNSTREEVEPGEEKAPERRLAGLRMGTVFDVSQTEGKGLPSLGIDELRGDIEGYEAVMGASRKASTYLIVFEDIEGGAKGYFSRAEPKRITVQEGMSQAQTLKTAVDELAHSVMHDVEPSKERASIPDRGTLEVQAESVAYVVSSRLGLNMSDYSFGYIASWNDGGDVSELGTSLDEMRSASHGISDTIEKEASKAREPEERERAKKIEREPGRGSRRLAERVGATRAASIEARAPERSAETSR